MLTTTTNNVNLLCSKTGRQWFKRNCYDGLKRTALYTNQFYYYYYYYCYKHSGTHCLFLLFVWTIRTGSFDIPAFPLDPTLLQKLRHQSMNFWPNACHMRVWGAASPQLNSPTILLQNTVC